MFFWLKKVAGFWLMPLPLSLALMTAGILLLWLTKRRRSGRTLLAGGALWLAVCSNDGVGIWLIAGLESRYPAQPVLSPGAPPPAVLERCRFVVVLGGGHRYEPGWPANLQLSGSALARIVEGTRLTRNMPAVRLLVSGPAENDGEPTHAHLLAETAISLGVAPDRIAEISDARDTEQEAVSVRRLVGDSPVALVTSAWHMPRALALCRRAGIDALPCPADYAARPPRVRPADFLRWNIGGLERSTKAIYEHIGATWSRLRGKA